LGVFFSFLLIAYCAIVGRGNCGSGPLAEGRPPVSLSFFLFLLLFGFKFGRWSDLNATPAPVDAHIVWVAGTLVLLVRPPRDGGVAEAGGDGRDGDGREDETPVVADRGGDVDVGEGDNGRFWWP